MYLHVFGVYTQNSLAKTNKFEKFSFNFVLRVQLKNTF